MEDANKFFLNGKNIIDNFIIYVKDNCNNYLNVFIVLSIVYFIILIICLYFIFKKENINKYYAFIPFVNLYFYYQIVNIPFLIIFVPVLNILAQILSIYNLLRTYGYNKVIGMLGVLFPYIFFPIVALSSHKNIYIKHKKELFVKTTKDIDSLENKLKHNVNTNNFDIYGNHYEQIKDTSKLNKNFKTRIDNKINTIESNAMIQDNYDDLLYSDEVREDKNKVKIDKKDILNDDIVSDMDTMIEIPDNTDIRNQSLIDFTDNIDNNTDIKVIDNADYKEYKSASKDVAQIAFGGKKQDKSISDYKSTSKDVEVDLRCPYCQSSLVNSNGICPGCARNVSNIINEYNNKQKATNS